MKRDEQPIIGVTTKSGQPSWIQGRTQKYVDVLVDFGATGVIISPDVPTVLSCGTSFAPDETGRISTNLLQHLDGLLLSGGGDVDPKYFGAEMNGANPKAIHTPRDELELPLAQCALVLDLPTFGICRGIQVLNVAAGGGMVQHFEGHRSSRDNPVYHDVLIDPSSRLYDIIGLKRLPTNTYHHQGIDHATLADLFTPSGLADPDQWLIEAFESVDHTWVIGVQWHPERLHELPDVQRELWQSFVDACRQRREKDAV
ncbi:gamma-glutamyl-gamma-aminobutyrate hydrolase family protein [Chloroflexi bacterium TSY]|nr:gamma-glutamyl-gamma-aminobutyrate hydrolase family protein [Chloroflexi bacterium TSY]